MPLGRCAPSEDSEEYHDCRMDRDLEDEDESGSGGGGIMVEQPRNIVDLTKPLDLAATLATPIDIPQKVPPILDGLDLITLPSGSRLEEPGSNPPSPETPSATLKQELQAALAEDADKLASTLGKLRTVDNALQRNACWSAYREDSLWRKAMRSKVKAPQSCDEDGTPEFSWYRDFSQYDLDLLREAFIAGLDEQRSKSHSKSVPFMPSLHNPLRAEAPPCSWHYLQNPYRFSARRWTVTSPLHTVPPRSRHACEQYKRGSYVNSRHCNDCRRENNGPLVKSLLVSKFNRAVTEANYYNQQRSYAPPTLYYPPGDLRIISIGDSPSESDLEAEPMDEDLEEVTLEYRKEEEAQNVRVEFKFDYRADCPESPRLRDLDEISEGSDEEGLWEMDCSEWDDDDDDEDFIMDT